MHEFMPTIPGAMFAARALKCYVVVFTPCCCYAAFFPRRFKIREELRCFKFARRGKTCRHAC